MEEGKLVYSVRFTDGSRVDINATSGAVERTKNAKDEKKTESSSSGSGQHDTKESGHTESSDN